MNFAELPLEASLHNVSGAWLKSAAGLLAAEAPQCWSCFLNQETKFKLAQNPLPHPVPMLLISCLVASARFGIARIIASVVVSQEVGSLDSSGYQMKWIFLFSLSVLCPGLF